MRRIIIQMQALEANGLKPICKFYKKRTGNCKFGDECKLKFWHPCDGPRLVILDQSHAVVKWNEFMGDMDGCHRGQDLDETVKLCSAWINRGTCHRGNACHLRHGTLGVAIGKARALWAVERRKTRAQLPSTPGDDVPASNKKEYRARAAVLAQWMVGIFNQQDLEKGVLDIAGGRGDLSFELSVSHSIRCTVVDPRPVRLNKNQHRRLSQALLIATDASQVSAAAQQRLQILDAAKELRAQGKVEEAVALLRRFAAKSAAKSEGGPKVVTQQVESEDEEEEEEEVRFFQSDPVEDSNNNEDAESRSFTQHAGAWQGGLSRSEGGIRGGGDAFKTQRAPSESNPNTQIHEDFQESSLFHGNASLCLPHEPPQSLSETLEGERDVGGRGERESKQRGRGKGCEGWEAEEGVSRSGGLVGEAKEGGKRGEINSLETALRLCKASQGDVCNCGQYVLSQRQEWFGERFEVLKFTRFTRFTRTKVQY